MKSEDKKGVWKDSVAMKVEKREKEFTSDDFAPDHDFVKNESNAIYMFSQTNL